MDLQEIKSIPAMEEDRTKYALLLGDVLFTEGGNREHLGRGAVWRGEIPDCIHQNHIFRARITDPNVTPEYVSLASKSEFARDYFYANASQTVNLASINLKSLSALPIPLPPLAEQHEIVRRVEALLARADRIEKRLATATRRVETLTQAILAQAFRGELVPTEAELARQEGRDYEPASVLLERIRRERSSLEKKKPTKAASAPRKSRKKESTARTG